MIVQGLEELRQTLSKKEQQASEQRCEELITQVCECTRHLLTQIEAMQETTARRAEAWAAVERNLNARLQEAETKAATAEERERSVNERLSQTLSRINVLEAELSCLRAAEQGQLSKSLEKQESSASAEEKEDIRDEAPIEQNVLLDLEAEVPHSSSEQGQLIKSLEKQESSASAEEKDIGDEAPIEQEPIKLHHCFEWTTCDMNSGDVCLEVYNLLKDNYTAENQIMVRLDFSEEYLRWALRPPGYHQSWHIGVRIKSSKELVAFISGVPARIRVRGEAEALKIAEIRFLCVIKKFRKCNLARDLIKEMTRRVNLENVWEAAYTESDLLKARTPITTYQYRSRFLNLCKLKEFGIFTDTKRKISDRYYKKLLQLPQSPVTRGFRQMQREDVSKVTKLLTEYLRQFEIAIDFDENDVEHWLLPKEEVVDSYVVVTPGTSDVTDFCSFYTVHYVFGNLNGRTVKCAYSFYNVATKTSFIQLMKDAMIVAKKSGFDLFQASDIMRDGKGWEDLQFEADGKGGHENFYYYLHSIHSSLNPSQLGHLMCIG